MARQFTLYWSNFKNYEECPQKFLWYRGWKGIDLGNGLGRRKTPPEKFSKHDAFMGIVIAKVIEIMYNNELWKTPATLKKVLEEIAAKQFELELVDTHIDWKKSPSKTDLYKTVLEGTLGYLSTFKHHRLVGPYARAEKSLYSHINKYTPIGGRADLIIRRKDTGITIIDHKNSKHKSKYLSPDQLRWYGLAFYLSHQVMPDRLGWVYYRFPYGKAIPGSDEVEQGVEWVEPHLEDFKGLAQRALEVRHSMDKLEFGAVPSTQNCKFCEFQTVCSERIAHKKKNARNRKPLPPLPSNASDGFGFGDL